jgi:hypothetical protein
MLDFLLSKKQKFPTWFEENLKTAYMGGGIEEYIRETYLKAPEEFEKQLKKAKRNSNRPGIGNENRNMWIAANETANRLPRYKHTFHCYYCDLPLSILNIEDVHFEHFHPKLQEPGNIVCACKWCDKFKADRTPNDFRDMMLDETLIETDKYTSKLEKVKLRHFIPLVVRHSTWDSRTNTSIGDIWLDKMIEIAKTDFKEDIDDGSTNKMNVRWRYYELFRSKWLPDEINKLALAHERK